MSIEPFTLYPRTPFSVGYKPVFAAGYPGAGPSVPVTVIFSQPVSSVLVFSHCNFCYDPSGKPLPVPLPYVLVKAVEADGYEQEISLDHTLDARNQGYMFSPTATITAHGHGITAVVYTPILPPYPWNWAFYVQFALTFRVQSLGVTITKALGPNDAGSFIARQTEGRIDLEALVAPATPAATVQWAVKDAPGDAVATPVPAAVPAGIATSFVALQGNRSRWRAFKHPGTLLQKSLAYEITASVSAGGATAVSQPVIVRQDEIDTMREEYVELRVPQGPPKRSSVREHPHNNGDYSVGVFNAVFHAKFEQLRNAWTRQWTLNGYFRNPVHHSYHISGGGSGTVSASWHQFGCAADLQTYPIRPSPGDELRRARAFWDQLRDEAIELGFQVEPRDPDPLSPKRPYSGVGHVHVQIRCPP